MLGAFRERQLAVVELPARSESRLLILEAQPKIKDLKLKP